MRIRILLALAVLGLAAPALFLPADAAAACPTRPCEPAPQLLVPVNYFFGVVIQQSVPNTVPAISGSLMNGCTFTAVTNYGVVSCTPPTAPPPNSYWTCDSAGLITTAYTGTVTGITQCNGGPAVVATATNPGNPSVWNIAIGTWGFAWTCTADFTSLLATGDVLCDEPDPPVQFW